VLENDIIDKMNEELAKTGQYLARESNDDGAGEYITRFKL
jgi:hypothetical protein